MVAPHLPGLPWEPDKNHTEKRSKRATGNTDWTSWRCGLQVPRGFGGAASAHFRILSPYRCQVPGGVLLLQPNLTTERGVATNASVTYPSLANVSAQRPYVPGRG